MKVTYLAAHRTNSVLKKIEAAAEVFTTMPELFDLSFWDTMVSFAANPKYAQSVLDELDEVASKGITVSSFVSSNLVQTMKVARTTLRNQEMQSLPKIY